MKSTNQRPFLRGSFFPLHLLILKKIYIKEKTYVFSHGVVKRLREKKTPLNTYFIQNNTKFIVINKQIVQK